MNTLRYKILVALLIQTPGQTAPISRMVRSDIDTVSRELAAMAQDTEFYGPLVALCKDGWRIAGCGQKDNETGGWQYLLECTVNGKLNAPMGKWKDEVLTGIRANGKKSEIDKAVLPTGKGSSYRDPERAAHRANRRG